MFDDTGVKNSKLQVYQKLRPPHPNKKKKKTIYIITYNMFYVTSVLLWFVLIMYICKVNVCQMYLCACVCVICMFICMCVNLMKF
jgi:hypothetical protein